MQSKNGYVFDTTCLNYLALIDSLYLLEKQLSACFIPQEVKKEIDRGILEFPDIKSKLEVIQQATWLCELRIEEPDDLVLFEELKLRWGKKDRNNGEAAAIVLARRHNLIAVIDEDTGRTAAKSLGVTCVGTVGLLVRFAALGVVSTDVAWQLHEQITGLPSGAFRSLIKDRAGFEELVGSFTTKLSSGENIL